MKKNVIVIGGKGEVGSAIVKIEKEFSNNALIVDKDTQLVEGDLLKTYVAMHVCVGYSDKFIETVKNYNATFNPELIIIHSTVPVGTTSKIKDVNIVHSPIRGIHPNLYDGITKFVKYVGGDDKSTKLAIRHLESLWIDTVKLGSSETTELLKILSTTYYLHNVLYAKEVQELCNKYEVDFNEVYTHANNTYNEGYRKLGLENVVRPILTPPSLDGVGGHCLIENAIILSKELLTKNMKNLLSLGKLSVETYKDKTWLFCEYIGKNNSASQIARKCGTTHKTIEYWLNKFDIPVHETIDWTIEEKEMLYELSLDMTLKDIYEIGIIHRTYGSILRMSMILGIKSIHNDNKKLSENTKQKISCTKRNIALDCFDGYVTLDNLKIRNSAKYAIWRKTIFKRDAWTCQNPNCKYCNNEKGTRLHAHHIKSFSDFEELRFNVDNGISYCVDYHMKGGLHKKC